MSDRDDLIERIGADALEVPAEQRPGFVGRACDGDASLHEEVNAWLADHERAARLLETAALASGGGHGLRGARPTIAGFTLLEELGRGGMGVVYLAEQDRPRRHIAIKLIRSGLAGAAGLRRFEQEAEFLGRLQHPGIAQVYEAGTATLGHGEQPFIAMELVRGASITEHARVTGASTRQRIELVVKVCESVEYAHRCGIIHRDLKPGNILVDAAGHPKILDFGVARATNSDIQVTSLRTDVGQLIGTLTYMSPEQARGDTRVIDARSDVYALGVILYELLAGRAPLDLRDRSIPEAARLIAEEDAQPLSRAGPAFRGDIETIVQKALEKDPDRRYASAAQFAADLRRFLNDEPIVARPASTFYQLRKFAKRNKALVGGVAATMLALAVGTVVATRFAIGQARARADTDEAKADLESAVGSVKRFLAGGRAQELRTSSGYLLERLVKDERPKHGGRMVALLDGPGKETRRLVFFNDDGERTSQMPESVVVPSGIMAGIEGEQRFIVKGAILRDVLAQSPGRELVVMMRCTSDQHLGLLQVTDLELKPLARIWHNGLLENVVWDSRRNRLILSAHCYELEYCVPELALYDSLGCPSQERDPLMIVAFDPDRLNGVLFPDQTVPIEGSASPEWAVARVPLEVENRKRTSFSQLLTLDPADPRVQDACGELILEQVTLKAGGLGPFEGTTIGRAHLSASRQVMEDTRYDEDPRSPDPKTVTLVEFDPARVARGRARAEPVLVEAGTLAETERRLRATPGLMKEDLDAAIGAAQAMSRNWRWLGEASERVGGRPEATAAERTKALAWAEAAVQIHRSRCPNPDACVAGWYPVKHLAVVQYRAGKYEEALATLHTCEAIWRDSQSAQRPGSGSADANALDQAFIAMAQHHLGHAEEARAALARARAVVGTPLQLSDEAGPAIAEAARLIEGK